VDTAPCDDELSRLRAEVAEWRRRAEVAEKSLEATNATLRRISAEVDATEEQEEVAPAGADQPIAPGRTLRERWRRYVESIN